MLVSTADLTWGHMWGVGTERKVVSTGLVGEDIPDEVEVKGKRVPRPQKWRIEANRALGLIFEVSIHHVQQLTKQSSNLDTLLSLLTLHPNRQILLPLYQLLARLVALPRHREALARWTPVTKTESSQPGPSFLRLSDQTGPLFSTPVRASTTHPSSQVPFILDHLLVTITVSSSDFLGSSSSHVSQRPNHKLLEATFDLLAALIKGQPSLASMVRSWTIASSRKDTANVDLGTDDQDERLSPSDFVGLCVDLLHSGPTAVRIAVAGW